MTEREVRTPALKPEEAALLPALSRSLSAGAALKAARQTAETIKRKLTAHPVSPGKMQEPSSFREAQTQPPHPVSRAALHQALHGGRIHRRPGCRG